MPSAAWSANRQLVEFQVQKNASAFRRICRSIFWAQTPARSEDWLFMSSDWPILPTQYSSRMKPSDCRHGIDKIYSKHPSKSPKRAAL